MARDPARYSFAHGSKNGIPYPVDRKTYDQSIELLRKAIHKTKLGIREKNEAVGRLNRIREIDYLVDQEARLKLG